MSEEPRYRRQWRDYRTTAGGRPVKKFLMKLTSTERAVIVAAMKEVSLEAFAKKTGKTPKAKLDLAKERLKDWREQGKRLRKDQAATEKSRRGS